MIATLLSAAYGAIINISDTTAQTTPLTMVATQGAVTNALVSSGPFRKLERDCLRHPYQLMMYGWGFIK
ncbi:unnamed protein product [Pieris brassicae]|uniref:Uncharacterized protein n=1 Tax=Pieris brassicae TaxID=7116 RepID=A0A9P0XAP6_PIEBR|nr:unnamed protein product [Pieris brassicae]